MVFFAKALGFGANLVGVVNKIILISKVFALANNKDKLFCKRALIFFFVVKLFRTFLMDGSDSRNIRAPIFGQNNVNISRNTERYVMCF